MSAPGASRNWCENVAFHHERFAAPETLEDVQSAVAAATALRALGSGHSFSALCRSEGTLLSLAYMRQLTIDVVDEEDISVRCDGGATVGDVVKALAARGMALRNVPSLPHVTVAGALATSTHGSGVGPRAPGSLAAACRAIDFVTADGSVASYARGDADFAAAVVHLGALGVVSSVTLDVVPEYAVDQRVYEDVPVDAIVPRLGELAASVDSLTVGLNLGAGTGLLWLRYFEGGVPPPEKAFEFLGGRLRARPVPFYESAEGVKATCETPWHDAPSFFMDGLREVNMPHVACQSEYFVPLEDASAALAAVSGVAAKWPGWPTDEADLSADVPVFHCELRAVGRDGLAGLAPFGDRDTLSIHFTWGPWAHRTQILGMIFSLEAALLPFAPRPHFGKLNMMRAIGYPAAAVDAFRGLADRHDPAGKFRNALVRRQVWGAPGDVDDEYPAL